MKLHTYMIYIHTIRIIITLIIIIIVLKEKYKNIKQHK